MKLPKVFKFYPFLKTIGGICPPPLPPCCTAPEIDTKTLAVGLDFHRTIKNCKFRFLQKHPKEPQIDFFYRTIKKIANLDFIRTIQKELQI